MSQKDVKEQIDYHQLLALAADTTTEGITISDMLAPDQPLIYVNDAFETLTGYQRNEAIGKNCRFLQGRQTDRAVVSRIRHAIDDGQNLQVEILNYKKDGTRFWNRLSLAPIKNPSGVITHYVGIQSDVTELRKTRARLEKANTRLRKFKENLTDELEQARITQEFILPPSLPKSDRVRFAAKFKPMEAVGGDFFDIVQLRPEVYGILVADVTGHGIPAALLTFMTSTTFKNIVHTRSDPAEVLAITNKRLFERMPGDAFVSMFYAIYDANQRELRYTQAGHPPAYLLRKEDPSIQTLTTGNPIVGACAPDEISFSTGTLNLQVGDKLIMYTDAITDILRKNSDDADLDRLQEFLHKHSKLDIATLFNDLYAFGLKFSNRKFYPDDFTMVGLEVL